MIMRFDACLGFSSLLNENFIHKGIKFSIFLKTVDNEAYKTAFSFFL